VSGPPISAPAAASWAEYRAAVTAGLPRGHVRAALERFLALLGPEDRAPFTAWFFRARYDRRGPDLAQRTVLGLLTRAVLVPELLAGARAGRPEHLRWLALAQADVEMRLPNAAPELYERSRPDGVLAAALARNPDAPDLWRLAFWRALDDADWGGHHMDEGILVLPEDRCRTSLAHARQTLAAAPDGALDDAAVAELEALEAQYADFFAWREAGEPGPFPDWCAQRGRDHGFATHHYYET
jgi:hypothetical protein